MTAAERFDADTWAGIDESKKLGYKPTRYIQMVKELGAVETAKRVLHNPTLADGFVTLAYLKGRPDLTTEALVVRYQDEGLFTDEELNTARTRLGEV
jgi:hypothetical protein